MTGAYQLVLSHPEHMIDEVRSVRAISKKAAAELVVENHYLHRRPPMSHAFGLLDHGQIVGVCTFGTPPSRHAQMSVLPSSPSQAIELNRLWIHDDQPTNSASWFVSRCLKALDAGIVFSYADTSVGHTGVVYRALNFRYAGWTDMERKQARFDYIPIAGGHTREAFRSGYSDRVRRKPKAKYWIPTGTPTQRRHLAKRCGWPSLSWADHPTPSQHEQLLIAS